MTLADRNCLQIAPLVPEGPHRYAEVRFFFEFEVRGERRTLAMVSMFSAPDKTHLADSFNTLAVCEHLGDRGVKVIDAKSLLSVISMVPFKLALREEELVKPAIVAAAEHQFFVCEKLGLAVAYWGGRAETAGEDGEGADEEDEEPGEA